jgi:predicted DNA-binding protein with PD1-like motif
VIKNMCEGKVGRICFFRLRAGEDLVEAIRKRAEECGVKAGILILIGSVKEVVLGYYKDGQYKSIWIGGPLEIASGMGNIAVDEKGEVIIHAHLVVSNEKGEAFGGHLMKESYVGIMAELMIIEASGANLQRILDKKTKLRLLPLD